MYEFDSTTKLYFGEGCLEEALKKERGLLGRRTLIVTTGRSLKKLGYLDKLTSILDTLMSKGSVYIYDNISNNPDTVEIEGAISLGKKIRAESVIGFGGGSAIDAAKATAVGIVSDIPIEDYLIKGIELPDGTLPVIAIPTTAGTGSELSRAAIISCRMKGIKGGIRGDNIIPALAAVDPVLTWSVPPKVTKETGFDAFCHAAESYLSLKANLFSEMLSEKAIKNISVALRKINNDPDDHDAREKLCYASYIMGYNLKNVGNCLPHRMQYPIGAETDTSHGAGLMAISPAWISHEYEVNKEKTGKVLEWLGFEDINNSEEAGKAMIQFEEEIGGRVTLTDLNVLSGPKDLADRVTGNISTDKLSEIPGIIEIIYKESY